jgi:hypothetical protein
MQILSYVFIGLFLIVAIIKLVKQPSAEELTTKSLLISSFSACLVTSILVFLAGWYFDVFTLLVIIAGIFTGLLIGLMARVTSNQGKMMVVGKKLGVCVWIVAIIFGEFMLAAFNNVAALTASFFFGLASALLMNAILYVKLKQIQRQKI